MTHRILIICLSLILLGSCTSSRKYLSRGQYEMALHKSVKKLRKKPEKMKEIDVLRESYRIANQKDMDKVNFLKAEGNPQRWNDLYVLYERLKARQSTVSTLPSYTKDAIGFSQINYDAELIEAKKNAAEYLYTHAVRLLDSKEKEDARAAWYELAKVKSYFPDYKDTDDLMRKAKELGMSYVFFEIRNKSQVLIPATFDEEIRRIALSELNTEWITYHVRSEQKIGYDYSIALEIKHIEVSPERVKEVHYDEKATVKDGWEYKLDEKGNVVKDSLGNDIKVDKYVNIQCKVIETQQSKAAILTGVINYTNLLSGQLIKTEAISVESVFDHAAAIAIGDLRALSKASQEKTKRKPVPFPSDADLILQSADIMKGQLKDLIWKNKGLLR
ncbi:MAG: hypothetical protein KDD36_02590 [Flavobacteriales bacterium]|nr:hypothetical protein [Flavobacteriales bacterium]